MQYEEKIVESIIEKYPKFKIEKKSSSVLMKIIHWALFILTFGQMKDFMSKFITVIGYTVYVPDSWESTGDKGKASVLVHEARHMYQKEKYGSIAFSLGYLFWPLPLGLANFRLNMEVDASAVEIIYQNMEFGLPLYGNKFWATVNILSSSSYFWPTFSRAKVEGKLRESIEEKLKNRYLDNI